MSSSPEFPTTHWSMVAEAGASPGDAQRHALTALLLRYMPPLRAYLIYAKGCDPHSADDVLQSFIADRILEQKLLRLAKPNRGRFRGFVLTALDNYLVNQRRYSSAKKRKPKGTRPVEEAFLIPDGTASPSQIFDLAWARELLAQAVAMMERECSRTRPQLWKIFEARVLLPATNGVPPIEYAQMVQQYGFATPSQAANALVTANRMFGRMLRSVIGRYEKDPAGIDEEIRELRLTIDLLAAKQPQPAEPPE